MPLPYPLSALQEPMYLLMNLALANDFSPVPTHDAEFRAGCDPNPSRSLTPHVNLSLSPPLVA